MLSGYYNVKRIAVGSPLSFEWHVGEKFPVPYYYTARVQEIQVDGDELIKIMNCVHDTIPFRFRANGDSIAPVQRWFGSTAKFICSALLMEYPGRE